MRGYRVACRDVIEARFEGHIVQLKGDGTLSIFGFPVAHENDAERAVRAGLALVRAVRELSPVTTSIAGEALDVRVARPPRPRLRRLRRGRHLRARRQRRRAAARAGRSRHGRRLRRGPAARRGLLRDRGRRPPDRQGRGRAARVLPGRRRAPAPGSAVVVDPAGRARDRARAAPAGLGAASRRAPPSARRECSSAATPAWASRVWWLRSPTRFVLPSGCRRAAARLSLPRRCGLPPGPEPGRGALWHPRTTPAASSACECLTARWRTWGSTRRRPSPSWRRSWASIRARATTRPRRRAASSRSRSRRPCSPTSSPAPGGRPAILVAEDLHWFDDATRAAAGRARARTDRGACSSSGPHATRERRPVGDDRAAPADPRRPPRAHRRARGGPDRAGSARARHAQ